MENKYFNAFVRGFIKAAALPGQPAMPNVNSSFIPKPAGGLSKLLPPPPAGVQNPALPIKPQAPPKAPMPPPQPLQPSQVPHNVPPPQPHQPLPPIILNREQWMAQERARDITQPALSGYLKNLQHLQNDQQQDTAHTFLNQGLIRHP